jgi:hypothetical protein
MPSSGTTGIDIAIALRLDDSLPGDILVWASGASFQSRASVLSDWDMTSPGGPMSITRGFVPSDCDGNVIHVDSQSWTLQPKEGAEVPASAGGCSAPSTIVVADASVWKDPAALLTSRGKSQAIVCGAITLTADEDIYWYLHGVAGTDRANQAGIAPMIGISLDEKARMPKITRTKMGCSGISSTIRLASELETR